MSEDDVLKAATRALRDETAVGTDDHEADRVAATRARVMRGLHESKRRRRSRALVWLPLVAIFVGGAAWATGAGYVRLPFLSSTVEEAAVTTPAETPPVATITGPTAQTPPPTPTVEEAAPIEEAPEELEAPAVEEQAIATKGTGGATGASGEGGTADADAYALYQRAHELHFDQQSYGAARTAWEAYLRTAPGGRFASEAAYNRAICLVRTGRNADAKQALQPFADGAYGGYRQSEARALLDAL